MALSMGGGLRRPRKLHLGHGHYRPRAGAQAIPGLAPWPTVPGGGDFLLLSAIIGKRNGRVGRKVSGGYCARAARPEGIEDCSSESIVPAAQAVTANANRSAGR
jgi:hypothetical protein